MGVLGEKTDNIHFNLRNEKGNHTALFFNFQINASKILRTIAKCLKTFKQT